MKTVLLAAGEGTRLRPLTETRPKPMVPIAGKPLLAHTVDSAIDAGATELVIVVGYHRDEVIDYFGDTRRDVPITYVEQTEQKGTAHAVAAASAHLDGPFAVCNGDNVFDSSSLATLFEHGPSVATMPVENPSNYGIVETENGVITSIIEKPDDPPSNLANAGAYVFPAAAHEWLDVPASDRGEHELTDVLAKTIDTHDVTPVELDRWLDVGRPWEVLEATALVLGEQSRHLEGSVHPDADVRGAVVVEPGATIEPGVVIEGPVHVGPEATIGPNAYVRGPTAIGEGAHVGHAVEIKASALFPGATVGHLSYVGDSILGQSVNLGAGTTIANLRHDEQPVNCTVKGERVSTGRRKFGVVLADDVKTGINTSFAPGVTLSPGSMTTPGEYVDRDR